MPTGPDLEMLHDGSRPLYVSQPLMRDWLHLQHIKKSPSQVVSVEVSVEDSQEEIGTLIEDAG